MCIIVSNPHKQNHFAVFGLLFGASSWGVIWYPYRLLDQAGISGIASSFYTYSIAIVLASVAFWRFRHTMTGLPMRAYWIGVVAGWTNLSYVMAVIDGEVMRVMLLFYLSPLWTLLLAHFWLKEALHRLGFLAIILSLSGASVMLLDWSAPRFPLPQNQSEWLALSSGIGFSLTNVMTRHATYLSVSAKSMLVWLGAAGMSLLILPWLPNGFALPHLFALHEWGLITLVALMLIAATVLVQYGITQITAVRASVLFLFELVVAAIAAYFLANEAMTWNEWAGGVLIVMAAVISAKATAPTT